MKYLYILTSDSSDLYYEQALLSITSLKMHTPNAYISLLIDDITEKNLIENRENILKLTDEVKSIELSNKFNKKARSRWLKTSMRNHIEGNFLFIDTDTIITEDLSKIEPLDIEIGAVLDEHAYLFDQKEYYPSRFINLKKKLKKLNISLSHDYNTYYNSGVIFSKDSETSRNFFNKWHRLWLNCFELNLYTDQPSFNQANISLGNVIQELHGIWNCQLLRDGAIKYLYNAKIIHYFASNIHDKVFILSDYNHLLKIKETGIIDQQLINMLEDPKSQFASNTRIMLVDKSVSEFYDSAVCGAAKRIYSTKIGKILEIIFSFIKKYIFTPIRKKLFFKKKLK